MTILKFLSPVKYDPGEKSPEYASVLIVPTRPAPVPWKWVGGAFAVLYLVWLWRQL